MSEEPTAQAGGSPTAKGHRHAVVLLGGVAFVAVLLDVLTKQLAVSSLDPGDPVRLLGGGLYLSLARNSGAAFSMFQGHTYVFPIIAVAVISWIVWMSRRLRSLPWAVALGLILGGAAGNLTDRLFRAPGPFEGHVVDFLSVFKPYGEAWPIFNVADMSLFCGVALAVLLELTGRHRDGGQIPAKGAADGESARSDARLKAGGSS